jgi:hypothetical protein
MICRFWTFDKVQSQRDELGLFGLFVADTIIHSVWQAPLYSLVSEVVCEMVVRLVSC